MLSQNGNSGCSVGNAAPCFIYIFLYYQVFFAEYILLQLRKILIKSIKTKKIKFSPLFLYSCFSSFKGSTKQDDEVPAKF